MVLYVTNEISEDDIKYIYTNINQDCRIMCFKELEDKFAKELSHYDLSVLESEKYFEALNYANDSRIESVISPCAYLAALFLHSNKPLTYICRSLIKCGEGYPLDKLVMENYIIRLANKVDFCVDSDKAEATKRYYSNDESSFVKRKLKKNLVLFGAGAYGAYTFRRLSDSYHIVAYIDNNPERKGTLMHGVPIISGDELSQYDMTDTDVVICIQNYKVIIPQLLSYGIDEFFVMLDGFLFYRDKEDNVIPIELNSYPYFKKKDEKERSILFTQDAACIRTHRTATIMKDSGYTVHLLYMQAPPNDANIEYKDTYDGLFGFTSFEGVRDYILNSDYDVIHCSNEPDLLANIALITGKNVVVDTHDMMSLRCEISEESKVFEYIANTKASGNLYTSEGVCRIAVSKFPVDRAKIFSLENMVLDEVTCDNRHSKLSEIDGEIHCVYAGSIDVSRKTHHRYFTDIWNLIVSQGIHIHIYSHSEIEYCKQLAKENSCYHYEGNVSGKQLISELTKYDVGLCIFNVTDENRAFLETASQNKIYEYLNAGIPIVFGDLSNYVKFLESHNVGEVFNPKGDIKEQLRRIKNIKIEDGYLGKHGLTVRSQTKRILEYYQMIESKEGNAENAEE